MRYIFVALLAAGSAFAQGERQPGPSDPRMKSPPVEYRSAFEGYRPYAEAELRDWRRANEEVGKPPAKPQPGTSGHGSHHK